MSLTLTPAELTKENDMMQFKDRLKLAMEIAGIGSDVAGMRTLAEYLGVTGSAISQAMKGQTKFNACNSARAARMLGVDLYWFATGEGEARDRPTVKQTTMKNTLTFNPASFVMPEDRPKTPEAISKWVEILGKADNFGICRGV